MSVGLMLMLDDASTRGVRHIRGVLAEAGVCDPPGEDERAHITLTLWRSIDQGVMRQHLPTFASQFQRFAVRFHGPTFFPSVGALCLCPVPTIRLLDIHHHAHVVFDEAADRASRHYAVDRWMPHVTLASGLAEKSLLAGMDILTEMDFPFKGTVQSISYVRMPDRYLLTCKLPADQRG